MLLILSNIFQYHQASYLDTILGVIIKLTNSHIIIDFVHLSHFSYLNLMIHYQGLYYYNIASLANYHLRILLINFLNLFFHYSVCYFNFVVDLSNQSLIPNLLIPSLLCFKDFLFLLPMYSLIYLNFFLFFLPLLNFKKYNTLNLYYYANFNILFTAQVLLG